MLVSFDMIQCDCIFSGAKEGYAGVGLYSKTKPLKVKYGLSKAEYDSEGRLITAEYDDFYVVAVCKYSRLLLDNYH